MCNNIAGLVTYQRQLCRENPDVMISIGKGAKLGVVECQQQFKDQRWNCSTVARDVSVFGKVTRRASRESAFVYAVSSAGVVHEVARTLVVEVNGATVPVIRIAKGGVGSASSGEDAVKMSLTV